MAILVLAEHDNQQLQSCTRNTLQAARQLGEDIHLLVAGHGCQAVAEQGRKLEGVNRVLWVEAEHYAQPLAEQLAPLLIRLGRDYSHLLSSASTTGKNLMPRVAAGMGVAQVSDIIGIEAADTFRRPIYAGNAIATIQALDACKVITVRSSAFAAVANTEQIAAIESLEAAPANAQVRFISEQRAVSDRPELGSARIVVSGGRGVGSQANFALIEQLADRLGAAVGASRAAVDAGYVANDRQVGQTGTIVAPDLYIAVGISGAIQHLAGMQNAKVIVAINKDPEAPIFQIADYGLVADLFEAIPELQRQL